MEFRTLVNKYEPLELIDYRSNVLLVGSCFAQHLHNFLDVRKYSAKINPCGIAFNPISICSSLYYRFGILEFQEDDIHQHKGQFFHYDFHSQFNGLSHDEIAKNIRDHLLDHQNSKIPDVIAISLGTAFVYKLKSKVEIVNNCHKVPQHDFNKSLLDLDQITTHLNRLIENVKTFNKDIQFLITVSPVRHIKDGVVENNRSKSRLLLACEALEKQFSCVHYFPSYELLMDDLRDYRFYDTDMVHPSSVAIDYIMNHFEKAFMKQSEREIRKDVLSILSGLQHKAFHPSSAEHQNFLKKLEKKALQVQSNFDLTMETELEQIRSQFQYF